MLKGAIARRYAEAIFQLAQRQNTLERTVEEVQELGKLFAQRKLAYLLREPKIAAKRKETALREALGTKVLPTTLNLALLAIQRNLVDVLPSIARELQQLLLDQKNQAIAIVTSARELAGDEQKQIQQSLERRTGKQIVVETRTDPAILGGVVARVGDQVIDGSVRRRLALLRQELTRNAASAAAPLFSDSEIIAAINKDSDPDATRFVPSKA